MFSQDEVVTVSNASSSKPSLVSGVSEDRKVVVEKSDAGIDASDVEDASMGVKSKEVTGETVAEPPAGLRLDKAMAP